MHTAAATISAIGSTSSGGKPAVSSNWLTVSATIAPTITTSPCAKLIRPRMPYTMV